MDMAGKMDRAFSIKGVPVGWICAAEKLNFQPEACGRLARVPSDDVRCRLPGGATGRTSFNGNLLDFTLCNLHIKFRGAEPVSIDSQTILPGEATSGGWGDDLRGAMLLSGGHQGNCHFGTELRQIVGKIRVLQKIQYQVRFNFLRQKLPGVIDDFREITIQGDNFYFERIPAKFSNTGDLAFSSPVLLKNKNLHR